MTGIDCIAAEQHWKEKEGAVGYLKAIGFVQDDVREGVPCITLSTDEEGNDSIALNSKAARWLAKCLTVMAVRLELEEQKWQQTKQQ